MKFPRATRQVEAQDPHPQRLVVPGQHRPSEVVETRRTCLAPVALAMWLRVVATVPDHRRAVASGAAYALRPAMLAHQREALGIVHQAGKVDQVGCSHDGGNSSREPVGCSRSCHHIRYAPAAPPGSPPRNPTRARAFCRSVNHSGAGTLPTQHLALRNRRRRRAEDHTILFDGRFRLRIYGHCQLEVLYKGRLKLA